MSKGWRREPVRHSLASKGVSTSFANLEAKYIKPYTMIQNLIDYAEDEFDVDLSDVDIVRPKELDEKKLEYIQERVGIIPPALTLQESEIIVIKPTGVAYEEENRDNIDWSLVEWDTAHEVAHIVDWKLGKKVTGEEQSLTDLSNLEYEDYLGDETISAINTKENTMNIFGKIIQGKPLSDEESKYITDFFDQFDLEVSFSEGLVQ